MPYSSACSNMAETVDINENVAILMFGLHVKKRTKKHFFSLWRDATASNRQVKLGLASGRGQEAPFGFVVV